MQAFVVTEFTDLHPILKQYLPEAILENIEMVAAGERYDAETYATSRILDERVPVVLILYVDMANGIHEREHMNFLHQRFRQFGVGTPFKIIQLVRATHLEDIDEQHPLIHELIDFLTNVIKENA